MDTIVLVDGQCFLFYNKTIRKRPHSHEKCYFHIKLLFYQLYPEFKEISSITFAFKQC